MALPVIIPTTQHPISPATTTTTTARRILSLVAAAAIQQIKAIATTLAVMTVPL